MRLDAFPGDADGEGCAVGIMAARSFTFGVGSKAPLNCTPGLRSTCINCRKSRLEPGS